MADITTLGMAVDSSGVRKATDDLDKLTKSSKETADATKELERNFVAATAAGNLIGESIGKVFDTTLQLVKGFVNLGLSVGRYQDLAEKTASDDPVGLASLRTAADVAGTSVDAAAMAINRMAIQLSKNDGEEKGIGKALASINLDIDEFKKLNGVEQYKALATALSGFADTQQKVQVVQAITGRGGAEQLVLLKELATGYDNYNLLTKEQIQLADKLEDNTARSRSQMKQMAEVLAVQTLPAIDAVTSATKDAIKEFFGLETASGRLKAEEGVRVFAEKVLWLFGEIVDAGDGVARVFQGIGITIGAAIAQADAMMEHDAKKALAIGKEWLADMDALAMKPLFSDRLAASMKKAKEEAAAPAASESGKPTIDFDDVRTKKTKELRDEYGELLITMGKKKEAEEQEYDLGRKLNDAEKQKIDVYAQINKFKVLLTSDQMDLIDTYLLETEALVKLNEAHAKEVKQMKDSQNEAATTVENAMKRRDSYEAERKAAELLVATYGMTSAELEQLDVATTRKNASDIRARTLMNDGIGAYKQLNELLNQQADELDRIADARERVNAKDTFAKTDGQAGAERAIKSYSEEVKNLGTATEQSFSRGIGMAEDQLTSLATGGKADIHSLIDYTIAEFTRLAIIRPLLNSIFGGGSSSGGGFGSLVSGFLGLFSGGSSYSANGGVGYSNAAGISGGRAGGGDVDPFSVQPVAERGPELATLGGKTYLMTGDKGGTITSNDRMGGGAITLVSSPSIKIDARSDQAQIGQIVGASIEESNKQLLAQLKASGRI